MWANMYIIVVKVVIVKVGVTRSLRARQMLKVDLCASGAGAYAPYAPPLPTGLQMYTYITFIQFNLMKATLYMKSYYMHIGN